MKIKNINKKKITIISIIIIIIMMVIAMIFLLNKEERELKTINKEPIHAKIDWSKLKKNITIPKIKIDIPKKEEKPPVVTPPKKDPVITTNSAKIFRDKKAMVMGDSMAEGLSAYHVLDKENVVWERGRRIDTMSEDLPKVVAKQPKYLFLAYGVNDLRMWNGRVDSFIQSYQKSIKEIQKSLPNTKIIINSVLPVSITAQKKDASYQHQPLFNERLKKMAKELNISFLENGGYLQAEDAYSTDGVHPKAPFFKQWGSHMAEYLEKQT